MTLSVQSRIVARWGKGKSSQDRYRTASRVHLRKSLWLARNAARVCFCSSHGMILQPNKATCWRRSVATPPVVHEPRALRSAEFFSSFSSAASSMSDSSRSFPCAYHRFAPSRLTPHASQLMAHGLRVTLFSLTNNQSFSPAPLPRTAYRDRSLSATNSPGQRKLCFLPVASVLVADRCEDSTSFLLDASKWIRGSCFHHLHVASGEKQYATKRVKAPRPTNARLKGGLWTGSHTSVA